MNDKSGRRVLVTGPSKVVWRDEQQIIDVIEMFAMRWFDLWITGDAPCLDRQFAGLARARGNHCADVPALWDWHRNKAGVIRNSAMMTLQPTHGVVFDVGTPGTKNMRERLEKAGVPILRVTPGWRRPAVKRVLTSALVSATLVFVKITWSYGGAT